jgi:glycosyltransferase involved in cell wall biosynthesis
MLISIVIPTYNRLDFLKKAVFSVRNQTNKNYEIIVSDNSSNDGTKEWLAVQDDIIFIRHNDMLPMFKNWNVGLKKAKGDFILLLTDDDLMNYNCIEKVQAVINPLQYSMILGRHDIIDENDNETILDKEFSYIKDGIYQPRDGLLLFAKGVDFRPCAIFFNKLILKQLPLDSLAEKYQLTAFDSEIIQLMSTFAPLFILNLKESIGKNRIWKNSLTSMKITSNEWHYEIDLWTKDFYGFAKNLLTSKEIKNAIFWIKFLNFSVAIDSYRKSKKRTMWKSFYFLRKLLILCFFSPSIKDQLRIIKSMIYLI